MSSSDDPRPEPGAASESWQDAQRRHLFFTWTQQRGTAGIEIIGAEGARVEIAGKGWVWDLESQVYNVNVGHRHPHVQQRMIAQIETLPASAPNALLPIRAELGMLLARHTGLHRAFLTTGGSEAVENAIKIARVVTGRGKVITRRNSYHGATLAVLGIAGDARKDPYASDLAPAFHIEDEMPVREASQGRPSNWLESLHALIARQGPHTVAAILLEGLTGTNGMQMPPRDFWTGVRSLCDEHGIMLIDDEIFSGFGRTGRWFAREHWRVRVDMMTIGKGLTSGYAPLAGVMVSKAIASYFDDNKLWCGLTHYAHPVSCAAAVGSIEVMAGERLVENAARVGDVVARGLSALVRKYACVVETRGLGLMRALVLDRDCDELVRILWELGAYAPNRREILYLCPPLCLSESEAHEVLALLDTALARWGTTPRTP